MAGMKTPGCGGSEERKVISIMKYILYPSCKHLQRFSWLDAEHKDELTVMTKKDSAELDAGCP